MKAYVLIQTVKKEPIAQALRGIPAVVSAEELSGPFDAIALTSSDSTDALLAGVVAQIQGLPGVLRALPAPLIRSLSQEIGAEPFTVVPAAAA